MPRSQHSLVADAAARAERGRPHTPHPFLRPVPPVGEPDNETVFGDSVPQPSTQLHAQNVAPEPESPAGEPSDAEASGAEDSEHETSGTRTKPSGGQAGWEKALVSVLEFVMRRASGDYHVDQYGYDDDFTETIALQGLRVLYDKWFRVEVRGLEHIPEDGAALVVSNHGGTIPLDSLMTMLAIRDHHPSHRRLRMLGADLVFETPYLNDYARKIGVIHAGHEDASALLNDGHLVGVWPEGFKGTGKPFSERYQLRRFGRGGFASAAMQADAPIVPCAVVGAEETYPLLANVSSVARLLGVPYAPVTPLWPLLGPLGVVPLPSKWIIQFCPPMMPWRTDGLDLDDPTAAFDVSDAVRSTIQETLFEVLATRDGVFSR